MAHGTSTIFHPVSARVDFPELERDLLSWWAQERVVDRYLHRNDDAERRFSFIDGPITANNPMGVHHAWGRTYKDVFQRFHNMLGERQRFQNGFDCQGLWVEVEVEKELGLRSKRDIETLGIAEFVERCKQRVLTYADRITAQSVRLGYWMDWDNSYLTMSDENNYTIWQFLKTCHERGWIYKGHDVMPWCPRCATGISDQEIVTEGYQQRTHLSPFVLLPLLDEQGAHLLVWTTTPWTLTSNVAAAVHPNLTYLKVRQDDRVIYLAKDTAKQALRGDYQTIAEVEGSDLVGQPYRGPFDEIPAADGVVHRVIPWTDVDSSEGTGIVHIAPGCGKEDYALSKEHDLPIVAPIDEFGIYFNGFDWLTGQYVHDVAAPIVDSLRQKNVLYRAEEYTHRYPVCWRCGTDLVFRLVDEWFISMNELRGPMMDVTRQARWIPSFGLERELDWLLNMGDWMISKKRYWGLALPIYECQACGTFEVIGSEEELKDRAVAGWDEFAGHTPHRPYVDAVQIACGTCGQPVSRIPDVGNPWLDAGIVALSTLDYRHNRAHWEEWYPADLITESFPGQFRNWFYALIAESTAMTGRAPFRTVFSYALMRDEHGEEMHKSKGNAIWFDDAADEIGVDVMRWLFCTVNPSANLNFGYSTCDEVRRRFILPLWNSYSFFVTYANIDGWRPPAPGAGVPLAQRPLLDRWIISRLNELTAVVRARLSDFDITTAARAIEEFVVEELSNWYIRRNRRRFWKPESDVDKSAAYETLYQCLVTTAKLLAPLTPFLAEAIHQNLVGATDDDAPVSVHLTDFPPQQPEEIDERLSRDMEAVLDVVRLGRAARSEANLKVRQPLPAVLVYTTDRAATDAVVRLQDQILDELNVKEVRPLAELGDIVSHEILPNLPVLGPKYGRRLNEIRRVLAAQPATDVASTVAAGEQVSLTLDNGQEINLQPDEVLVTLRRQEGFAAAQSERATVVLDTTLTPELVAEGIARDFVRGVQDARRQADLRIEEMIRVSYTGDPEAVAAIAANENYVKREILASSLTQSEYPAHGPQSAQGAAQHRFDSVRVGNHRVSFVFMPADD